MGSSGSQDKMNKALVFVLLGALCAAGLPTNRKDAAVASKGGTDFVPEPDTITGAPPVEERKKKSKKAKATTFVPEPDTITGAPPVEERKKKSKKAKATTFIPEPDTI